MPAYKIKGISELGQYALPTFLLQGCLQLVGCDERVKDILCNIVF